MRIVILTASFLVVWLGSAIAQYQSGGGGSEAQFDEYGCPLGTHDCVSYTQCTPQGDINTDGAGLIDWRTPPLRECTNPNYPDTPSLCCRIPGVPPATTCPGFNVCVEEIQCNPDGSVNTDGAGIFNPRFGLRCYTDTGREGICCRPPPPRLETCPGGSYCSYLDACTSEIYDAQDAFQPYQSQAIWAECLVPGTSDIGVCCLPPVIDICPIESVCLPKDLCIGDIIDSSNNYQPYETQTTWSQCPISGDIGNNGVCCRNPTPVSPPPAAHCGVRNSLAADGLRVYQLQKEQAQFAEFPWQAIIFYTNFTFVCGASLVTNTHLVTAAHCVYNHNYIDFRVRLGEWQVDIYDEPLPYLDVEIKHITLHENFKPSNLHNDVAVIELAYPVTFQYHINTVCLPTPDLYLTPGTRCFATGWGKDAFAGQYQPRLKKVDVPFVASQQCQDQLRATRLGRYFELHESFLCAGGEPGIDACTGDGGGPLVCESSPGRYSLYGIVAWGIDCGQPNVPGVYADARYFSEWISNAIYGVPVAQVTQPHNPYSKK